MQVQLLGFSSHLSSEFTSRPWCLSSHSPIQPCPSLWLSTACGLSRSLWISILSSAASGMKWYPAHKPEWGGEERCASCSTRTEGMRGVAGEGRGEPRSLNVFYHQVSNEWNQVIYRIVTHLGQHDKVISLGQDVTIVIWIDGNISPGRSIQRMCKICEVAFLHSQKWFRLSYNHSFINSIIAHFHNWQ